MDWEKDSSMNKIDLNTMRYHLTNITIGCLDVLVPPWFRHYLV